MHLVNTTPVPARCLVGPTPDGRRHALVIAKATFAIRHGAAPELCTGDAVAIHDADVPTELGLLPADTRPRRADSFEVILLGRAYPEGGLATAANVALSVGDVRRELLVVGRRVWHRAGLVWRVGGPAPFEQVPLTWAEAYGGTAEVELGPDRRVELIDPLNRHGKGFDPSEPMGRLPRVERVDPGYPRTGYLRELPRVEDPATAIEHWHDRPEPACWATIPPDIGFATIRTLRRLRSGVHDQGVMHDDAYDRAHPDWTIAVPRGGAPIEMLGLHACGRVVTSVPRLRVVADFVFGRGSGTVDLAPRMLVLEPERGRMTLLFRKVVAFDAPEPNATSHERTIRLRLEEGFAEGVRV